MKQKKRKTSAALLITFAAAGAVFAAGGFLYGFLCGDSYAYEKKGTVEISTAAELKALEKDEVLNDDFVLTADITVSGALTIGTEEHPFAGTFSGNGYTITYSKGLSPLFGYVAEGAVIEQLAVSGEMECQGLFAAGIAGVNSGEISNCLVDVQIVSGSGTVYAGGVVGVNYGTVSYTMAQASFTAGGDMTAYAGGVAAANYGTVQNCAVTARYTGYAETDIENNYSGTASNHGVGAVCGIGGAEECFAEELGYYLTDLRGDGVLFLTREELYAPEYIFQHIGFSHSLWLYADGEYRLAGGGVK